MPISMVLFKDEAGVTLAGVEWDIDEWIVFCGVTGECGWRHRHRDLSVSCEAAVGHIESHGLVGAEL